MLSGNQVRNLEMLNSMAEITGHVYTVYAIATLIKGVAPFIRKCKDREIKKRNYKP